MSQCDCAARLDRLELLALMREDSADLYWDQEFEAWLVSNPDATHKEKLYWMCEARGLSFAQAKRCYLVWEIRQERA